ncbi:dihydropteroate synthase [Rhodocaloribacter litoris]|uniref:dihydropteroate synthase n=1 Tax=Rhodocaloribacter litoris TaxID=2558931 RepID=UPI001420CD45|nr:dihydropteroate synthase [Rhodocaloribacter litoris]QXD16506.1 dihydropteroate synthase [Rhodocaloribacter litoris]GIV59475.1 MAG: dihydropteroate synthase [Rhodothermaceae bacterium]
MLSTPVVPPHLTPEAFPAERFVLDCRGHRLDCRPGLPQGAHVMGILNVTPDSFYDGGRYTTVEAAVRRATEMVSEGAAVIDVGGASSRPRGTVYGEGARPLSPEEEIDRVRPVIEALAEHLPGVPISIDTYHPEVARAALEAGASLVNDITGLRLFPETAAVAAAFGAPLIVMHSLGRPGAMPHAHTYTDVVADVAGVLRAAVERAEAAGVRHVVVDPGFGFGKTPEENLRLLEATDRLLALERPVLVGVSRKSTIGAVLGTKTDPVPPSERLFGSLGATAVAVLRGATLVRTHDVRPTVELLRGLAAAAGWRAVADG